MMRWYMAFQQMMPLKEGDIVSVDVGVFKNGFHGDSAYTFAIGEIPEEVKETDGRYKGISYTKALKKQCMATGWEILLMQFKIIQKEKEDMVW